MTGAIRSTDRPQVAHNLAPDAVVADIGAVTPAHLTQAQSLLNHLPQPLLQMVRSQPGAVAVCYGLLLDTDTKVRSRQKQIIADSEAELLRAILIALGCPVPPFIDLLPAQ